MRWTNHAYNFSSISFSTFSRKLLSTSASDCRFDFIMANRTVAAWLHTYLACDHSKVNCAINWDTRLRGLLLICLHNTFVLCVHQPVFDWVHSLNSSAVESKLIFLWQLNLQTNCRLYTDLHRQSNYVAQFQREEKRWFYLCSQWVYCWCISNNLLNNSF